jgi:hypothetical protein
MASVRALVVVLLCSLGVAFWARPAAAGDAEQARAAFSEGQKLFLGGDYRGAMTWFKKGYLQTQDPAFLLNLAQCHRSLRESQEALMMFRLYLSSSPEGVDPQSRAAAAKAIKELESETKNAPPASNVGPASTAAASVAMDARPGSLPTPASGRRLKTAPASFPVLDPTPELDAAKPTESVTGDSVTAAPAINDGSSRRRYRLAAVLSGAVGLASVGTGVYYWTRARSLSDSANQSAIYDQATYDDGKHAETMQWIFFGVGTAAVATAAGLFVYSQWFLVPKQATLSLAPMLAPSTAGLAAVGIF